MNKMNIKMLPPDVITLIYSFGYPEHREYMNKIGNQLRLFKYNINLLYENYLKLYRMDYLHSVQEFLTYAVDDEVLEDLFKQCTRCYCCSKHCHNRPNNYYTNEVSIGENFNTDEICHCKCRSLSRMIKRSIPKTYYGSETDYIKHTIVCRRRTTFNHHFIPLSSLTLKYRFS